MLSRIPFALGLVLLPAPTALVKVFFIVIIVSGSNLKEPARIADPALIAEFSAFADFSQGGVDAPAEPGAGYAITRYRWDGQREVAFDRLHYYPDAGFVYYDGLVNGSSGYDGKWYTAAPGLKATFETALFTQIRLVELGRQDSRSPMVPPPQSAQPIDQTQSSAPIVKPEFIPLIAAIITSLTAILGFAFWRRRSLSH